MSDYRYTIGSFLNNPVGAGAASAYGRKTILDNLRNEYQRLRQVGKFSHQFLKVDDSVLIAVRVPSASFDNFHYDVVIEFQNVGDSDQSLTAKEIRVFSNAPSFVFTYAYVFEEREMLIPYLRSLIGKEALSTPPRIRNPDETINYEKTVVLAMIHILSAELMKREQFDRDIQKVGKLQVKKLFRDADSIAAEYKKRKAEESAKKKAESAAKKAQKVATVKASKARNAAKTTKNVASARAAAAKRKSK